MPGAKLSGGCGASVSKVGISGRICVESGRGRHCEMRTTRGRQTGKGRRPGGWAGNMGRDLREVGSGEDRGFGGRNGGIWTEDLETGSKSTGEATRAEAPKWRPVLRGGEGGRRRAGAS